MAQRFVSTTTPLAAAGGADTFDSGWMEGRLDDRIVGSVFADKAGTLFIEQSYDLVNADISTSYTIVASDGSGFSEEVLAPYWRVRVQNTAGTPQTLLRLRARLSSAGSH